MTTEQINPRARHIREVLAEMREERARERFAAFCCKLFFAHVAIVCAYFFLILKH